MGNNMPTSKAHTHHLMQQGKLAASLSGKKELHSKGVLSRGGRVPSGKLRHALAKAIRMAEGGAVPDTAVATKAKPMKQVAGNYTGPVEQEEQVDDDVEYDDDNNYGYQPLPSDPKQREDWLKQHNDWLKTHPYAEDPVVFVNNEPMISDDIEEANHQRSAIYSAIDESSALQEKMDDLKKRGETSSVEYKEAEKQKAQIDPILNSKDPERDVDGDLLDMVHGNILLYAKIKNNPELYDKFNQRMDNVDEDEDDVEWNRLEKDINDLSSGFYGSMKTGNQKLQEYTDERGITHLTDYDYKARMKGRQEQPPLFTEEEFRRMMGSSAPVAAPARSVAPPPVRQAKGGRIPEASNKSAKFVRALLGR